MSSGRLQEGRAAAKLAYEEGNGLVALYLTVECVVELEERIQQLEEALRFYADEVTWEGIWFRGVQLVSMADQDNGEMARTALSREPSEAPVELEGEDG